MTADTVFQSLQERLRIRSWVTNVAGVPGRQRARRGDLFTMAFQVTNMAPDENISSVRIRFRDPHIIIQPTEFATFPDGSRGQQVRFFPRTELKGGQSSTLSQQFLAVGELGDIADEFSRERIADVWVVADVPPEHYFKVSRYGVSELEIEG